MFICTELLYQFTKEFYGPRPTNEIVPNLIDLSRSNVSVRGNIDAFVHP